jgi:CDP-4-dehydro-6-deoxyglucose reductase, E1
MTDVVRDREPAHETGEAPRPTPDSTPGRAEALRDQILALVSDYHEAAFPASAFVPGETPVPVSGRVFDADEIRYLVDASLDFWLTTGRFAREFERTFARVFGARCATLVNSGSSANLVALSALTSPAIGDRRLRPGDEVITVAAGFPTTVNPILQNGLVPVFIDVTIPTLGPDVRQLEEALGPRTRAVMIAHTLGNPFDLGAVTEFVRRHDLLFVEDCCDALGATYDARPVGTFGDVATVSFYPAHHITMGEGGAVVTNKPALRTIIESFRDWGRDCWCEPGKENTCGKRFAWQLGSLPCGYDHKYTYSHVGYNLKATDMQAAVGVAQLKKLPAFLAARRRNFAFLYEGLEDCADVLMLPEAEPKAEPSWFGFPMTVREGAPFTRNELVGHLESRQIATRMIFAGNLVRQPAYEGRPFRVVGDLAQSDRVMNDAFWIGVFPGLTEPMLEYVVDTIRAFCRG